MYTLSVPIMNASVDENTRDAYLKQLKSAKADRVFLCYTSPKDMDTLAENVGYFKKHGIETGVWIGETIGHGAPLNYSQESQLPEDAAPLVDTDGRENPFAHCPLDPVFIGSWKKLFKQIAGTHPDFILLDDDFRLSQHGSGRLFCACGRHLEAIGKEYGGKVTREDLKDLFVGKTGALRKAWLKAQSGSLYSAARAFREAVDEVDGSIPIAACSVPCHFSVDGVDHVMLTNILAGKGKKLLRLSSAPYHAVFGQSHVAVTEIARMFAASIGDKEIETISEGDTYPRPRYNVPSSYLELFDLSVRLDGNYGGILKYMIDYNAGPDFENGYIRHHRLNRTRAERISGLFGKRANVGVRVFTKTNYLGEADISTNAHVTRQPYPEAGVLLGTCGIPTVYSGEGGYCAALFGDLADVFDKKDIGPGLILDSRSAEKLEKAGIDVGLERIAGTKTENVDLIVNAATGNAASCLNSQAAAAPAKLKRGAQTALEYMSAGEKKPFAYRYENAAGQRFFVYLIEFASVDRDSGLYSNYEQQAALFGAVEWISNKKLP
ncbi:MAG: hypothetical protein IJV00_03530, partial [Clostridia bacterium]|nr:hypothetical protein [Clostridia bacterium]